jgi:hypothetical protein
MRTKTLSATLVLLILSMWPGLQSFAAPQPPLVVVNHETKECGTIMGGDECMDCFPPEGWEILGFQAECPAGYTEVSDIPSTCKHFKDQFCCTQGHSGVAGDCEDLVRNEKRKQCAFVEDVADCQLPKGWNSRPAGELLYDWLCPNDYEWVATLDCVVATSTAQTETASPPATEPAVATDSIVATSTAQTETTKPEDQSGSIPCLGAALVGPAIILLWLVTKTKR